MDAIQQVAQVVREGMTPEDQIALACQISMQIDDRDFASVEDTIEKLHLPKTQANVRTRLVNAVRHLRREVLFLTYGVKDPDSDETEPEIQQVEDEPDEDEEDNLVD